jgi:hypothetical protein
MRIIGCDLHARQQTLAMLDTVTGEVVNTTLKHEGNHVQEFYSSLPRPVRVGIEATGSMQMFAVPSGGLRSSAYLRRVDLQSGGNGVGPGRSVSFAPDHERRP